MLVDKAKLTHFSEPALETENHHNNFAMHVIIDYGNYNIIPKTIQIRYIPQT